MEVRVGRDKREELPLPDTGEVVDALLRAGHALVSLATRSLGGQDDEVTRAQYRVLVMLSERGPQRLVDLAEALAVSQPNATRICARLSHKGLIRRSRSSTDRRTVRVSATRAGRQVVKHVSDDRATELGRIVGQMAYESRQHLVDALDLFCSLAGETPGDSWALGWAQ